MTKIIAMYLPQYYETKENNLWWGEGYTDWKAVKNANSLFPGHRQPRVPVDDYYYDLSNVEDIRKQAKLASDYGIYGFGIYHYWFSSKQNLLTTPPRLLNEDNGINIHYFFTWDNGSWKRTWSNVKFSNSWAPLYENNVNGNGPEILAKLDYGNENDWKAHFDYLLPFFTDDRYIKIAGKPLFGVFNQDNEPEILKKMFDYWNILANQNGFPGVCILGRSNQSKINIAEYQFDYEPCTHGWIGKSKAQRAFYKLWDKLRIEVGLLKKYDYSRIWNRIIKDVSNDNHYLPGAFVRYDDTPRRGRKSSIVIGEKPELFEKYMRKLIKLSTNKGKEFIFLTAWNEWGEGAYLEPDKEDNYRYLEALKRSLTQE